jgi:two-component system, NtrC family, sensor kinase
MTEVSESVMLHSRPSSTHLGFLNQSHRDQPSSSRWLGTSIIILTIAIATGLAIAGYTMVRAMLLESIKQNALLEAKKEADDVDRWLATRMAEVQTIANTPTIRSLDWNTIHPHFDQEVDRIQDFVSLSVGFPDGTYYNSYIGGRVANSANQALGNISDRVYFQKAIAGEANISDPFMSRSMNMPNIAIAAPVWQDGYRSKAPIAEIHAQVKVDRVAEVIQALRYGDGSYAFVLNTKGEAIIHPDRNLMTLAEKPAPSLRNHRDPGLALLANLMIKGEYGITKTAIAKAPVYVVYVPLRTSKWSIGLVIPQQNIESKLAALHLFALVLSVLPIVAGIFAYRQVRLVKQAELRLQLLQNQKYNLKQYQRLLRKQAQTTQTTLANLQKTQSHLLNSQTLSNLGQLLVGMIQEVRQPNNVIMQQTIDAEQDLQKLNQLFQKFTPEPESQISPSAARYLQTAEQAFHTLGTNLQTIQTNAEQIHSLTQALKGLTQNKHQLETVNINLLLDDTLRLLEYRLLGQQKHLAIQVVRQYADLPMIECHVAQLNQLFVHLFNNAIDAIELRFYQGAQVERPSIRIRSQLLHSGHILIRITDNGRGIAEEHQDKLFTPFFTTKSQHQGVGLGLFVCQSIVHQHQGHIRCISIPNRGTDFLVELPLKQPRQRFAAELSHPNEYFHQPQPSQPQPSQPQQSPILVTHTQIRRQSRKQQQSKPEIVIDQVIPEQPTQENHRPPIPPHRLMDWI